MEGGSWEEKSVAEMGGNLVICSFQKMCFDFPDFIATTL
jgi:hypothetical protein